MDKSIESKETVLRGRGTATFSKGLVMHRKGSVSSDKTFWVSGGSSVVRKNIFDKLGAFDQLYNPFYWEDIDLSYRAQKSGYDIRFEKKSVVTHIHSEGSIKTHFSDEKVRMIAYRNQLLFVWKNITDSSMLLSHIFYLPYHIAKTLLSKDIQFVKALFIAITMIPDIIAKRSEQSKLYKKTDKELISKN